MSHDAASAHAELNRSSRGVRARYAPHRQRVMDLLPAGCSNRIALLGAGNANDVDLEALAARFSAVELVDIDSASCDAAVAALPADRRAVCRVSRVDLTGVADQLSGWRENPPSDEVLRSLPEAARKAVAMAIPDPCEVVVSSGVLSQLVWSCMEALSTRHPSLTAVAMSIAVAHLRAALDRTRPGGHLVLAVDTIAMTPAVMRDRLASQTPLELLAACERDNRCLPCTEPRLVIAALERLCPGGAIRMEAPWRWDISDRRSSLVYGLVLQVPPG